MEEEYFRRKEREAIEKLRERAAEDRAEAERAASALQCPRCDGTLKAVTFEGVEIDRCDKCAGVWLDAGELERLTEREQGGWLSRWRSTLAGE